MRSRVEFMMFSHWPLHMDSLVLANQHKLSIYQLCADTRCSLYERENLYCHHNLMIIVYILLHWKEILNSFFLSEKLYFWVFTGIEMETSIRWQTSSTSKKEGSCIFSQISRYQIMSKLKFWTSFNEISRD